MFFFCLEVASRWSITYIGASHWFLFEIVQSSHSAGQSHCRCYLWKRQWPLMDVHTVWKPTCRSLGDCFQPNIQTCMETCVNDWGNPMLIIFHPSSIYLPIDFHQVRYVSHGFFPSFFSIITQFSIIFPSFSHGFSHGFFPWIFPMDFSPPISRSADFCPVETERRNEVWCLGRPA